MSFRRIERSDGISTGNPPIGGTMVKISAAIPLSCVTALAESARANDRSVSAVIRRALTEYLTSPSATGSRGPSESRTPLSQTGASELRV